MLMISNTHRFIRIANNYLVIILFGIAMWSSVVPNGSLKGYIERTSQLDLFPISTVAEADFGYLNKAPLTKAQAAVVRRIESAISKHAKPHDFLGVEKELATLGAPGRPFFHMPLEDAAQILHSGESCN